MLETKRLLLKPQTIDNVEKINKWKNDPIIRYYDSDLPDHCGPTPLESTKSWIEDDIRCFGHGIYHFSINRKDEDSVIGFCQIAFIDTYNKSCRFGIVIGEKEAWGKGYGKEVLQEITRYCFGYLGMNRIGAEVYAFNERSVKLFESTGFKREGIIRECIYKKGKFEDEYLYGLLKSEWKE